jgi:hypothetical protein
VFLWLKWCIFKPEHWTSLEEQHFGCRVVGMLVGEVWILLLCSRIGCVDLFESVLTLPFPFSKYLLHHLLGAGSYSVITSLISPVYGEYSVICLITLAGLCPPISYTSA